MGLTHRRRWRIRIGGLAALSAAVLVASWFVPPVDAVLKAFTQRMVTAAVRIEPVVVAEYFLLQAVTCQLRSGLGCEALTLPDGRGFVARRPSIDPANAISRREARREISEGLASARDWARGLRSAPGAALYTIRYITRHGWEAWASLALSLGAAMTLLFWLIDSSVACVVLAPVVAVGVSWSLASILRLLGSSGWQASLLVLASVVVVFSGWARDLFEGSATFERLTRWRRKRHLARASLDA